MTPTTTTLPTTKKLIEALDVACRSVSRDSRSVVNGKAEYMEYVETLRAMRDHFLAVDLEATTPDTWQREVREQSWQRGWNLWVNLSEAPDEQFAAEGFKAAAEANEAGGDRPLRYEGPALNPYHQS